MVNLDEIPTYIPKHILEKTDEQYCRAELARYYSGETLEKRVQQTLQYFQVIGNIKEFDFCEEYGEYYNLYQHVTREVRLVWKKRLPLQ